MAAAFRLASIVASSDDAIVSKTLEGVITTWNQAAERMFGFSSEEAIGQSIRIIIPPERWSEEDEVLRQIAAGHSVEHFETERRRKDGSPIQISLTVSPIRNAVGRIVGASKIARDITERKRFQAQMADLLQRAEAANRSKDEFLAVLSHELRTPLNAILGWSELLTTGEPEPALVRRGLQAISRNVKAQTRLIEDLLDISRIVSGKIRLDVRGLELAPIVEAAVEGIRPAAAAKRIGIQAVLAPAGTVAGDADRLQQVVWNLLSNAVKFTPEGGHVRVALVRAGSRVEIVVSDDGTGIPEAFLPHVFERFRQADSSSRRTVGGLGLGLAIARELVELHGGTLEARSAGTDQGATFVISLPVSLGHPIPAPPPARRAGRSRAPAPAGPAGP
ncbi:MAG TPA: ATP-binding protein [Gemmatimonadales bacterium]